MDTLTAHHLLDSLVELGIEHLFCNLGTDHASIIEAMADFRREGRPLPRVILCPHENVAIHMAGGHAALSGRGQAVLVHVDAGTANAAMGMHNLFRSRLPVLLMAGRSPFTLRGELPGSRDNYVHFVQDPFDIGSLVRPYVKWEYALQSGAVTREVLGRAHAVMHSEPAGPVYLTLPRETLAERWDEQQLAPFAPARHGAVALGGADPAQARRIAEALLAAERPVVLSAYLGRKAEAVEALESLALECGIAVAEFSPTHLCISREHPCFAGFDPARAIAGADVGLLLDVDVPWLPKYVQPDAATRWLQVDVDPLKSEFPMWGFATDLRLQADCAVVLQQVLAIVRAEADDAFRTRARQRVEQLAAQGRQRRQAAADAARAPGARDAISPAFALARLGAALRDDDILVNEAIRNAPLLLQQVPRRLPLSLIGSAGGGLGYSGGMALGARLARPEARVVQVVGDGGFHFSTPTSVYAVAQREQLPILTVVLDNGGWQAVKEATLRMHPDGEAARSNEFQARLTGGGGEVRDFAQVAQAFGAHGETVREPEALDGAIERGLAAVERGRAALLHVRIQPF